MSIFTAIDSAKIVGAWIATWISRVQFWNVFVSNNFAHSVI